MKKWLPVFTLFAAAWLALSGCAVLEGQDVSNDPSSDEGIASIANSRLNGDAMTGRATLSVSVADGFATLYGTAPNQAATRVSAPIPRLLAKRIRDLLSMNQVSARGRRDVPSSSQ